MKKNSQPKDTAFDRRRFLLKSASVAGAISTPTLIGLGSLATSGSAMANPIHTSRLYANDEKIFYQLSRDAGWADWDFAEVQWQNSDDAMTKSGTLRFYKYWWKYLDRFTITADYDFSFKNVIVGTNKDLNPAESLYIAKNVPGVGGIGVTKEVLIDRSPRSDREELRRRLQYEPDWGADWQIPLSWQSEFLYWNTNVNIVGRPNFGVYAHQWGDRRFGVAMRALFVYDLFYDVALDQYVRRATPRRVMYLFGAQIQGQWLNLAIDQIVPNMLPDLNIVGAAVFIAARMALEFDPDVNVQYPYYGWRNDVGGQRDLGRALLGAMLGQLVGNAQDLDLYALAIRNAQAALLRLRDRFPRLPNGVYRIDGLAEGLVQPPRIGGVQADPLNFGVVNVEINQAIWLNRHPRLGYEVFEPDGPPQLGNPLQFQEVNAFPQVIPNDLPRNDSTNIAETISEDAFNSAWSNELAGNPNSNADFRLRALLSDF